MEPEPTRHSLTYETSHAFGWRENGDELVLVLPPRPTWEVAYELSIIVTASTGFLLIYGAVAYYFGSDLPPNSPMLRALLVLVGLLAIGQWVLVLMRVMAMLRTDRYPGMITVTPEGLGASNAVSPGSPGGWWPRHDIANIRLDAVNAPLRRVSLQVATRSGTVGSCVFSWPPDTPIQPYLQRLREALALADVSNGVIE